MITPFEAMLLLLGGCGIGWAMRSAHVWQLRSENKELRENLAYATSHPSTSGRNVVPLRGRR